MRAEFLPDCCATDRASLRETSQCIEHCTARYLLQCRRADRAANVPKRTIRFPVNTPSYCPLSSRRPGCVPRFAARTHGTDLRCDGSRREMAWDAAHHGRMGNPRPLATCSLSPASQMALPDSSPGAGVPKPRPNRTRPECCRYVPANLVLVLPALALTKAPASSRQRATIKSSREICTKFWSGKDGLQQQGKGAKP